MKKVWFFDLDGTLADTDRDIRESWKAAIADLGLSCPDFDEKFITGPSIEEIMRLLFPSLVTPEFIDRVRKGFGNHYDNDGFPNTREYPGMRAAVERLRANGAKVFIATNKRWAGAVKMYAQFGWDKLFDGLYTGDMHMNDPIGKLRKPELLKLVMKELGVDPSECVMVGDTINDFEAAAKNGITSVAVDWGYGTKEERAAADFVVSAPDFTMLSDCPVVRLASGRERSVVRHHPWIFSGAITEGAEGDAGVVEVVSSKGITLGYGWRSPASQIRVRMLSFDARKFPSPKYIRDLVRASVARRDSFFASKVTNGVRLINAENDGLPGVVADYYAGHIVCQLTSSFADAWKREIAEELFASSPDCLGVSVRNDVEVRAKEGLPVTEELETLAGSEPPAEIEIAEGSVKFLIDVRHGHKTGFYLDQRDARATVGSLAKDAVVLNCFSYTGGFGLYAAAAGAKKVTQVDISKDALAVAERNAAASGLESADIEYVAADVFKFLRKCRDEGRKFDLIVLDPPKFAETKSQVMKAARGYKDINLLAMKLLAPKGCLATFSCSGAMDAELFDKILAEAAEDSKRDFQMIGRTRQGEDHPVALSFPEGLYLKGVILRSMV